MIERRHANWQSASGGYTTLRRYARVIVVESLKTFIPCALVEFEYGVDISNGFEIAERHFIRRDTDNGAVSGEQRVDGGTLIEADDLRCEPHIRYGGIPRARDLAQWRQK